ncbi:hypothetical protein SAMD00019534_100930 [Acytostelium subglobosum LB1]|uniref:hypothetical protein n=1 Tax=Acytostelium subglobosum LB1 TaxID=1410327 RepID=UPI000644F5E9|nr:hypothetical protein SAMD00019534_100930 [Acytostelium subglobosum LB1]GAM26918.1 hypothetical protein SAMD00019534_100930 [Acytostelium subglobosum LB1]|eukprot:XP_012750186.1 hypothetical protein SAMD00019534_100930 [Acytostelium subglobosum LB1]
MFLLLLLQQHQQQYVTTLAQTTLPENTLLSTSLYNGYALIGANPNSRMPYVTFLKKSNISIPYSSYNQYIITQILSSPMQQFGATVAVGPGTINNESIIIGAIGSPTENAVYIFNLDDCSNKNYCDELFSFQPPTAYASTVQHHNTISKPKPKPAANATAATCQMGNQIAVGPNFVISSCQNNLMTKNATYAPLVICFLDLDSNPTNCSSLDYWDDQFNPCQTARGQLYVTALDLDGPIVTFSYCAVCMMPTNTTRLSVQYVSAFVVLNITSPTDITLLNTVYNYNRTNNYIAMGYNEESGVDLFYSINGTFKYAYFDRIVEPTTSGFGSVLDLNNNLLVVSAPGSPTQQQAGAVYFYEIFDGVNGTPTSVNIQASIPSLNYRTTYSYGFVTTFSGSELMLVSMDQSMVNYDFDAYSVCPTGQQWYSALEECAQCPTGQYKSVSNPAASSSFELCFLCPGGYYSGNNTGITSIDACQSFYPQCNETSQFCPYGSVWPIDNIPVQYVSTSIPNPIETDTLDFESTFYNSYPWFLVLLGFLLIMTVAVCLPWPRFQTFQTNLVTFLLKFNFYDWTGAEATEEEDYIEKAEGPIMGINSNVGAGSQRYKTGIFIRKRRTKIKPTKAVESFCTLYLLLMLGLMILFLIQFQKVNKDISLELRAYGQASTDLGLKERYTEAQYLKFIDSSPLQITIDIFGYTGNCTQDELLLTVTGCQTTNYMGECKYILTSQTLAYQSNVSEVEDNVAACRFQATFNQGLELSDTSTFSFAITPFFNYFYAQRIIYNVSTLNNDSFINNGNSYVSGVVQPQVHTVLRPEATVSVLSMITFMTSCKIHSSNNDFTLVRPMVEKCLFDKKSYKDYSFISNSTSYLEPNQFHESPSSFTFKINIEKSVFFRYVTYSYSVSFGQIVTGVMFAMLDIFWILDVFVPVIQYFVKRVDKLIRNNKRKEYDEIGHKVVVNEMEPLVIK